MYNLDMLVSQQAQSPLLVQHFQVFPSAVWISCMISIGLHLTQEMSSWFSQLFADCARFWMISWTTIPFQILTQHLLAINDAGSTSKGKGFLFLVVNVKRISGTWQCCSLSCAPQGGSLSIVAHGHSNCQKQVCLITYRLPMQNINGIH